MAKSSSMAALMLLVVAVLVGTCVPGAFAAGSGKVDLVNLCSDDAVIVLPNGPTNILVKVGATDVEVGLSSLLGIVGPVYIKIKGVVYLLPTPAFGPFPGEISTRVLVKVEFFSGGDHCAENAVTVKLFLAPLEGLVNVQLDVLTVCADVVIGIP